MSWYHLGGLNPNYKEFAEKHPNKTLMGMMWSMQWRLAILVIFLEAIVFLLIVLIAFLFAGAAHPAA